ncbi:metalloregulator ArsR/SmtB family transcription factor [Natroniella sulfidigena]|uniref:ArsR/SmtB family transcription factor n=1 Tax=Natroniella sulfidigena TaxID=723921 RepID=UPI00200A44EB|nr:metalloregulator ArsR/SmtB family transcription factor [Natroniella sulfidigena]MCK8816432.1 metalloregulator ArsR/SmtB family transcription factor [Natroniella sulfidigena]
MKDFIELTELLKAIADQRRLQIIDLLSCGKMCVCDITEQLDLSQPNISHHLKILKNAGLIVATKRGRWVDYQLNRDKLEYLQESLGDVIAECDAEECGITRLNCEEKC